MAELPFLARGCSQAMKNRGGRRTHTVAHNRIVQDRRQSALGRDSGQFSGFKETFGADETKCVVFRIPRCRLSLTLPHYARLPLLAVADRSCNQRRAIATEGQLLKKAAKLYGMVPYNQIADPCFYWIWCCNVRLLRRHMLIFASHHLPFVQLGSRK
ncbi:hypothetical protein PYH37_003758 [Sinorhizobium numidicum]|uniref:Uncharacterized protein n=1 Tax=Sinorhizobium numidicum TaxID=680248 RepID=A0ABY8D2Y7_9HYPH|nr:hypothetical protein [Sinorhizobium numidicum]WEX79283.1 hypothetical protein PYH37_003758 [Sinorhizobium numidicum]WEX85263.1 hypothetical protein PYH38_004471 [Sinorhizobium numidicum]